MVYIHGSTYVHTYFLVSSPKGLFRNNHYLQSLHLITTLTLLLITVLNLSLITMLNVAKKYLQNYLRAGSLKDSSTYACLSAGWGEGGGGSAKSP